MHTVIWQSEQFLKLEHWLFTTGCLFTTLQLILKYGYFVPSHPDPSRKASALIAHS